MDVLERGGKGVPVTAADHGRPGPHGEVPGQAERRLRGAREVPVAELADIVGVERVLFGSDYPHPEGLAQPSRYIDVLNERTKLSEEDKAKVMGGNLARLIAA